MRKDSNMRISFSDYADLGAKKYVMIQYHTPKARNFRKIRIVSY